MSHLRHKSELENYNNGYQSASRLLRLALNKRMPIHICRSDLACCKSNPIQPHIIMQFLFPRCAALCHGQRILGKSRIRSLMVPASFLTYILSAQERQATVDGSYQNQPSSAESHRYVSSSTKNQEPEASVLIQRREPTI